jgi:phage shock protein PspC (stress-responsive transcriptional regulator)
MFLIAGALEGLGRQLIIDTSLRYLIAVTTAVLYALYFITAGRSHDSDRDIES